MHSIPDASMTGETVRLSRDEGEDSDEDPFADYLPSLCGVTYHSNYVRTLSDPNLQEN